VKFGRTANSQASAPEFEYRAFLSYRNADARQAEWLHRKLEGYLVPRALVGTAGDYGRIPRRLGRIYRDRDEARPAEHIEGLIAHELSRSQHLVVLCTPSAVAEGSWVPREIALFRERRPNGVVHAVIGAGAPPAVFPAGLLSTTADGRTEAPLAADLRPVSEGGADGAERGLVRLVAGLLGVRFDDLWRREERRKRVRRVTRAIEALAVAAAAVATVGLGNFYRTRASVSMNLAPIMAVASSVRIVGSEEVPAEDRSHIFLDQRVTAADVTRWVPTSSVILRVIAESIRMAPSGPSRGISL
jgi:hypothetical protein